eukprot:Tbor_TRINITY_DN2265_c0_g1::TRINITY_DN2265_c0_g1_i1::g.2754::m.2754/K09488/TRAP1, HSP75; TNF receptor-associated protein 1
MLRRAVVAATRRAVPTVSPVVGVSAPVFFSQRKFSDKPDETFKTHTDEIKTPTDEIKTPTDEIKTPAMDEDDVVVEPMSGTNMAAAVDSEKEHITGEGEDMDFKTETRQLLDIVACSLYTDKEVFIRELVSNCSDALEKRRHFELQDPDNWKTVEGDSPPGISISCNQSKSQFIIQDTGVGMTKEELMNNLGTIAGSGSKKFVSEMQASAHNRSDSDRIIGQFGVGFYSIFMVAKSVKVYSRSAKNDSKGYMWESEGQGRFKIYECEGVEKGTKIVLDMKDTELSFCTPQVVERILKKYSNFVSYGINLNGGKVNTVEALWMKSKQDVSNEEHNDFYKFVSGAYDSPMMRLHYSVDAPLLIRAILYVPQSHTEKFGGGRMETGVGLYSRRVLIQSKAKGLMPEWLRFLKGAVDCESVPLNVSREHTQDSAMIRRLSSVITKRCIRWLEEEAKKDRSTFERFIKEFGPFLKEGVCTDQIHKMDIAKLLRFETTNSDVEKYTSLDEYRDRMIPNQTHIYYLTAPSKEMGLTSPYYEQYKDHGLEVLILTESIDDFVMQHLDTYAKHKLQNIEMFDATHDGGVQHKKKQEGDKNSDVSVSKRLNETQVKALSDFFTKRLVGRIGICKSTERLRDSPAVLADHESAQMRKLYKITGELLPAPKYNLHFNPTHEVIRKMYTLSQSSNNEDVETAGLLAEQIFDNATIAAGLMEDPRSIVQRLNSIMEKLVKDVSEPTPEK